MVTFVMFKWYELLHYKEIPTIYWMTLVRAFKRYIPLIYLITVLNNMFLTAVRHEVNNLESSVVVQELKLAINLAYLVLIEFR